MVTIRLHFPRGDKYEYQNIGNWTKYGSFFKLVMQFNIRHTYTKWSIMFLLEECIDVFMTQCLLLACYSKISKVAPSKFVMLHLLTLSCYLLSILFHTWHHLLFWYIILSTKLVRMIWIYLTVVVMLLICQVNWEFCAQGYSSI